MTDTELADWLNITPAEAAIIIPQLTPEKRAVYERMFDVYVDLQMGVTPPGVIVCRERRSHGHARRTRRPRPSI